MLGTCLKFDPAVGPTKIADTLIFSLAALAASIPLIIGRLVQPSLQLDFQGWPSVPGLLTTLQARIWSTVWCGSNKEALWTVVCS
jgi:hypothetical protein